MRGKRFLALVLAALLCLSLVPVAALAADLEDSVVEVPSAPDEGQADLAMDLFVLENLAPKAAITHSGKEPDSANEALWVDGNYNNEYEFYGAKAPTTGDAAWIELDLGRNYSVGGFEVAALLNDSATFSYQVTVLAKSEEEDEWVNFGSDIDVPRTTGSNIQQVILEQLRDVRFVKLIFRDSRNVSWCSVAEIKIYGLENIAAKATITHSGRAPSNQERGWLDNDYTTEYEFYGSALPASGDDAHIDMDLGDDYPVGGFELAVVPSNAAFSFNYTVMAKSSTASEWTVYGNEINVPHTNGNHIKQAIMPELTDIRYIRFVLRDPQNYAWGAVSQLKVFGVAEEEVTPGPGTEPDLKGLVRVEKKCEITAEGENRPISNMTDGDVNTLWVKGAGWPAVVDFQLPGNLLIQRVEIDFEKVAERRFGVTLSRAVNNVTSDYQTITNTITAPADETYVYDAEEALRMTHLRVTLSDPVPSTLWAAIAEIRIYAVDETIDLKEYDDISEHGEAAGSGNIYTVDFGSNQQIAGFKINYKVGVNPEDVTYSVKGKLKKDTGWTPYTSNHTTEGQVLDYLTGMSAIQFEFEGCTAADIDSIQVYGVYEEPVTDGDNVAFGKPTHGNYNTASSYLVTDGNKNTSWQPDMYPAYVDIDLEENYDITSLEIYTPAAGYTHYTVYTSLDGRDFDLVAGKQTNAVGDLTDGDKYTLEEAKDARIVRVYLEYYSGAVKPVLNEVRVLGTPSGTNAGKTTAELLPELNVTKFGDTEYAKPITDADTVAEVQGIVERKVGAQYVDWFTFVLAPDADGHDYDYFTLSDENGKIKVTGNNGVSLATGVNHYLKYFCNVNIAQVGDRPVMPDEMVKIGLPVHKETEFPVRYAYNYCTHSYTMAFWGEDEWRNEIDWLALNGVNVVLDITGQEIVWLNFLKKLGYSHQEAKDFLAGPGYYAWAYMANLTGFGGPIHDSYIENQTAMAQADMHSMRALGMEPVLQAFSGMVPTDLVSYAKGEYAVTASDIIAQGMWCSFQRPTMLRTDHEAYAKYAALFYQCQKEIYGDAKYYATDPFHEGGNTGGMSPTVVSSKLLDSLLTFDSDAVWVIQSWQGNPSNALLEGLRSGENPERTDRRDHALVLDLYAEKTENWRTYGVDTDGDGYKEFSDTPWVFCMLNNFGGRMGLHGHLDALASRIPAAAKTTRHMKGVGMSPEGDGENPILYDFLFETIWTDDASQELPAIDVDEWLKDYVCRRYGADSLNGVEALDILAETVYKGSLNQLGQGSPESVINARPALTINAASTWGNAVISYDKTELEKAARLLLNDYDLYKDSDGYLYDLADILKQVLSNSAQELHRRMVAAYIAKDSEAFDRLSADFLALIDLADQVMSTRKEFLFGTWTSNASELAKDADDFTQRLFLRNAKALVTTWGSYNQCNTGGLKDYSNRQWSGLTTDFYKARWEKWISACKTNLANDSNAAPSFNWFEWEWAYARDPKTYSDVPNAELSLKELGEEILRNYSVSNWDDGSTDDRYDYDYTTTSIAAFGSQCAASGVEGPAANIIDGDTATYWHTPWDAASRADPKMWVVVDLGSEKEMNGLRYLPRPSGLNGTILSYEIYGTNEFTGDETATWTKMAEGSWDRNNNWKRAAFTQTFTFRYVKLLAVHTAGNTGEADQYASGAEIRIQSPTLQAGGAQETEFVPAAGLTLADSAAEVAVGGTLELSATVTNDDATRKDVVWTSSDPTVAHVSKSGVVTGLSCGTVTITAASRYGEGSATCTVRVCSGGSFEGLTWLLDGETCTVTGTVPADHTLYLAAFKGVRMTDIRTIPAAGEYEVPAGSETRLFLLSNTTCVPKTAD